MLGMTDWQKGERREIEKDIAHLAAYMQSSMKTAFRNDPKHRMTIVESARAAGRFLSAAASMSWRMRLVVADLGFGFGHFFGYPVVRASSIHSSTRMVARSVYGRG